MIVYNITIKVNRNIADKWMKWQKQEHIPEIMETKLFDAHKIYHLLDYDDEESITFTFQYFTSSKKNYEQYISVFANALREKAFAKWGSQFVSFMSAMEAVK